MKKKSYQTPSMQVVELHKRHQLLAGNSGGGGPVQAPRFYGDTFDDGE
jgi:hypothetical protein